MAVGWAGSKGGVLGDLRSVGSETPSYAVHTRWMDLADRVVDLDGLLRILQTVVRVDEVSVFVNSICNLECRYCYVRENYHPSRELDLESWDRIMHLLADSDARVFAIVGREPLLSPELTLEILGRCRRVGHTSRLALVGLVSNLHFLDEAIAMRLAQISPGYLDVSVDGDESVNDGLRGNGSFSNSMTGLVQMCHHGTGMAERLYVLSTLTEKSVLQYPEFVRWGVEQAGITHFVGTPYVCVDASESDLRLTCESMLRMLDRLADTLSRLQPAGMVDVIIGLNYTTVPMMLAATGAGWMDQKRLTVDDKDDLFALWNIQPTARLLFPYKPVPETFWKGVRITSDGYLMGGCEMGLPDHHKHAVKLDLCRPLLEQAREALVGPVGRSHFSAYLDALTALMANFTRNPKSLTYADFLPTN